MRIKVEIAVYPYVYHYIQKEYGPAEYYSLGSGGDIRYKDLYTAISYWDLNVVAFKPPVDLPESWYTMQIEIDDRFVPRILTNRSRYRNITEVSAPIQNTFMLKEFWNACKFFVRGMKEHNPYITNKAAIQIFFNQYGITEDIYSIGRAQQYFSHYVIGNRELNRDRSNKYRTAV